MSARPEDLLFRGGEPSSFQVTPPPTDQMMEAVKRSVQERGVAESVTATSSAASVDPELSTIPRTESAELNVRQLGSWLKDYEEVIHVKTEPEQRRKDKVAEQPGEGPAFELRAVKLLLEKQQVERARARLAEALTKYPSGKALLNLQRVISPGRVTRKELVSRDRTAEIAWIDANKLKYEGKWVALLEDNLIAVADTLEELLVQVREKKLKDTPLVHHLV